MEDLKKMIEEKGPAGTFNEARKVASEYIYRLRDEGKITFSEPREYRIPTIHLVRRTFPEVWEDTTMALMAVGQETHTHYDPTNSDGDYESFPSLEASVTMHIEEPFGEPRFHKHYLGGWMGFGDYKAEIEGVKDGWMISPAVVTEKIREGRFDDIKGDGRWNYMYSQRMRSYPFYNTEGLLCAVNQLDSVVNNLAKNPTSRSAQCITWDPRWDHNDRQLGPYEWDSYHSPCLQRFWFRLYEKPGGRGYVLNVSGHWRSRDHLKAVPCNIFGITEGIHEEVRKKLEEKLDRTVERGGYIDVNDSLHLYGHYFDTRVQGHDAESYLGDIFRIASGEPIEERVILPDTPMYEMMNEEIEKEYRRRIENPNLGRGTG